MSLEIKHSNMNRGIFLAIFLLVISAFFAFVFDVRNVSAGSWCQACSGRSLLGAISHPLYSDFLAN